MSVNAASVQSAGSPSTPSTSPAPELQESTPATTLAPEVAASPNPPPAQDPQVASKFAALARKERAIRQQAMQLKQQRAQMAEEQAKIAKFNEAKDPISVLQSRGYSYADAAAQVLNQGQIAPETRISELQKQIEAERAAREAFQQERLEHEKTQAEAELKMQIDGFKSQVQDYLKTNSEAYELINMHESQELVYSTIEEHFNRSGKLISIKEGADLVEDYLSAQVEKSIKAKRLASKYAPVPAPEESKVTSSKDQRPLVRTLTNQGAASPSSQVRTPARSAQEAMQRALAALKANQTAR